jgi:flagellar export protein FliJ
VSAFKFRLARLLDLRHLMEREGTRAVATTELHADAVAEVARAAALRYSETRDQVARQVKGPAGLWAARLASKHALASEAQERAEDHRSALDRLAAARARLVEAHRARNTIERLRHKQHTAWLADESHSEQTALDEAGRHRGAPPEEETTCNEK